MMIVLRLQCHLIYLKRVCQIKRHSVCRILRLDQVLVIMVGCFIFDDEGEFFAALRDNIKLADGLLIQLPRH